MRLALLLIPLALAACDMPIYQASVDYELSPEHARCLKAAANVDPAVNDCNDAELTRQDAALNAAYAATLGALPPEQKPKLVEAERRWIAWRNADCAWRRVGDGALDRQMEMQCLIRLTRERVEGVRVSFLQREN